MTAVPRPLGRAARRAAHPRRLVRRAGTHLLLLVAAVVFGYPLLWMLFGAGKTMRTFFSNLWWVTSPYHWSNYVDVWTSGSVGRYLLNSVIVTSASIALNLVLTYPLAFAIARIRFLGHRLVHAIFAICLFVPIQLMIIPLYSLENDLHLLDTYWALILPYTATQMPFSVVFVTAYLRTIPREVEEAAALDGCSRLRMMTAMMVPLSMPAFATAVIFGFLHVWNEFLIALTVTHSPGVRTIPLGLLNFMQQQDQPDFAKIFAALAISVVPIFAVFLSCQRQFISGLMAGATKL
jgi:raffinose/stachyose/melibiose transport system permease protein